MKKHFARILIFLALFLVTCEKPNNAWEAMGNLDPKAWAPENLEIGGVDITVTKLTWVYGNYGIEGFKIDRKKGDEPWLPAFHSFSPETRSFTDTDIIPGLSVTYLYRLYAFAGTYNSSFAEIGFYSNIPAPEKLKIILTSNSSLKIEWEYNHTGHGGFRIDRKVNDGNWQEGFADISQAQFSYLDESLDLETNEYSYRVYVYLNQYKSDFATISSFYSPEIGDTYEGGIVFYLDGTGGGLACAETDQSPNALWGCYETLIGVTATGIYTGVFNTASIVTACQEEVFAAKICDDLELNGFSDWFLPSKDELSLMYRNLKKAGIGGFSDGHYWSSSETNFKYAWGQYFDDGMQYSLGKYYNGAGVRAVRAF